MNNSKTIFSFLAVLIIIISLVPAVSMAQYSVGRKYVVHASYYGRSPYDDFDGKTTSNCTTFSTNKRTAAHKTLRLGTVVELCNPDTGKKVRVTITDRGPFVKGRDIDVAWQAVGVPLDVGAATPLTMKILHIPEEPVMGEMCRK